MSRSTDQRSTEHQHVVKGSEVFVGGLSRGTTEDTIHEVFSSCGEIVEIRLIKDNKGNSKGFCFIRFGMKEAAQKAIKEKSGITLEGKKIGVLPSTEQDSLFLGNLRKDWVADEFDKIVRQAFPDVVSVNLAMPFYSGDTSLNQKQRNRGFAIVKFSSHAAAARAHRLGSKSDFLLAANCHPIVDWAEEEPEVNPEELAKIKIAFVRNLPIDADENYLTKLFEPLGELDRVVISKKSRSPVGFVHFTNRLDLDNAIREMNGKTVEGPNGGPSFNLQVEVARPIEKNRKRACEDTRNRLPNKISNTSKSAEDEEITSSGPKPQTQQMYSLEEPMVSDPYETAVVLLPAAVKERLLRILRLGIATRFDIDIQSLTTLKELPESAAISVLDQFMLSGADRLNKGDYLAGLISRHQVDKLGLDQHSLNLRRVEDIAAKELQYSSYSSQLHLPAVDTLGSRVGMMKSRYDTYTSHYSPSYLAQPLPSRATLGKMEESSSTLLSPPLRRTSVPSVSYGKLSLDSPFAATTDRPFTAAADRPFMAAADRPFMAAADRQQTRPRVRFDPFTGEPYKFDPFTGEPIVSETLPHRYGSPY
ncbi:hypothetical protein NMG60_11006372 [Bertholletia excelsa]